MLSALTTLLSAALPSLPPVEPPRLLVIVAVDQLIPEQLARLGPQLDGGLGRFVREGARFPEAALPYAATETGPGHATLGTGCLPRTHGLVGNEFWDRARRRKVYCVGDESAALLTRSGRDAAASAGRSPRNLRVASLGDHLRVDHPGVKVVSISGKDRAAITLGGQAADAVVWWHRGLGAGLATSSHYSGTLPSWAAEINAAWPALASGWRWEPTFDLAEPPSGTAADDREGEGGVGGRQRTFPYELPRPEMLDEKALSQLASYCYGTPLVDRFVAQAARAAVVAESLGADEVPDVLALSFSACDTVGHTFGPYSAEVTDLLLRLDDELGQLFELLDQRVGAGRWVAALSADHGVLPLPESIAAAGLAAERLDRADVGTLRSAVNAALSERFGDEPPRAAYLGGGFALDEGALRAAGLEPAEVRAVVAEAARGVEWVAQAYTLEQLLCAEATDDPLLALCRNSSQSGRVPDVELVRQPYSIVGMATGTSHGSPYEYDRRIPLLFLGSPFPAGAHAGAASSADVVPTLLLACGVQVGEGFDGRAHFRAR